VSGAPLHVGQYALCPGNGKRLDFGFCLVATVAPSLSEPSAVVARSFNLARARFIAFVARVSADRGKRVRVCRPTTTCSCRLRIETKRS